MAATAVPALKDLDPSVQAQLTEARGLVAAVNRAQAVIEFELDGTILAANQNFLDVVGYSQEEIVGQHHRVFVDPAEAATPEYAQFWSRLGDGQFEAGEFKRIGKSGNEVWLQATYNPILDAEGNPSKVVKFATDVTAEKVRNAEYLGKVTAVDRAQAVIEFNLDGTIVTANKNFCDTVGYALGEIEGKHHRMFVDPAYADSSDYSSFWERLGTVSSRRASSSGSPRAAATSGCRRPTTRSSTPKATRARS